MSLENKYTIIINKDKMCILMQFVSVAKNEQIPFAVVVFL